MTSIRSGCEITALLLVTASFVFATICGVVPVYADQSQSFVWVADTRGDANDDLITTSILTPIVDSILAMSVKPKVVIFGGDAAYRGGNKENGTNLDKFREVFTDRFTAEGIPSAFAIGNHELYTESGGSFYLTRQQSFQGLFNTASDLKSIKTQNGPANFENLAFSFHVGNSLFIIADSFYATTNAVEPTYGINQAQQDWMKGLLENNTAAHTFVLTHVPAWSPKIPSAYPPMTDTWTTITTSSANNTNASILFAGHEHLYYRTLHDGTYQVLAGTGGAPIGCEDDPTCNCQPVYPGDVCALRYNYAVTSINGREITVSVFDQNNSSVDMFNFFDYSGVNNTTINNTSDIKPAVDLQQPTGILAGSSNIITNSASISNVVTGIDAVHNTTITNSGSITPMSGGNGILVYDNNIITNTATGSIIGDSTGLWGIRVNTGNTVVNQGTVSVSGVNSIAFLAQGDNNTLTNSGTLGASGPNSYAATFLGTGNSLVNSGSISGDIWLRDGNTFTNNGTFTPAGTFINNGILKGNGTINGHVTNNGTIAPGNSIGTLTINGNYTQNTGSTYIAEIDDHGNSDRIHATGTAALNGGAVSVVAESGTYSAGMRYQILRADGGVSGMFDSVVTNLPSFHGVFVYDSDDVFVFLLRYADLARTRNQFAVATYMDAIEPSATGDLAMVLGALDTQTGDDARTAFNQLMGEPYADLASINMAGSNLFTDTAFYRMWNIDDFDCNPTKGRNLWAYGIGNWQHQRSTSSDAGWDAYSGYDNPTSGFMIGYDKQFDNFVLGFGSGYGRSDATFLASPADARTDLFNFSSYGKADCGPIYVAGVAGYTHGWNDVNRRIQFDGLASRRATASVGGNLFGTLLQTGYNIDMGNFRLTPLAGLRYVNDSMGGTTETGADSVNLVVGEYGRNSLTSHFGGKLAFLVARRWRAEAYGQWEHEYADVDSDLAMAFTGDTSTSYIVRGVACGRDGARTGLVAIGQINDRTSVHLNYDSLLQSSYTSQQLTGGLSLGF